MKTPSAIFSEVVKGRNFMTPQIINHYEIKNGAVELSAGEFLGDKMFGVTVVQNGKHEHDLSKSFHELGLAKEYINSLK